MEVTINPAAADTPSAQIIKAGNKTVTRMDGRGRTLVVKRLTALERMRIFAFAGPELSKNEPWLGLVALASSVTSIDGEQVVRPNNVREVEMLIQQLDDDGLEAVTLAYVESFGVTAQTEMVDAAKN